MTTDVELFNQHRMDTRNRLNFLVQSILLLAGGALTASIAVFTGSRTIELPGDLPTVLGFSWWALVASICLAILVVTIVLLRDYALGERWRKAFSDPSIDVDGSPGLPDVAMIVCGILSVLSFLAGFVGLAYVATAVVVA